MKTQMQSKCIYRLITFWRWGGWGGYGLAILFHTFSSRVSRKEPVRRCDNRDPREKALRALMIQRPFKTLGQGDRLITQFCIGLTTHMFCTGTIDVECYVSFDLSIDKSSM